MDKEVLSVEYEIENHLFKNIHLNCTELQDYRKNYSIFDHIEPDNLEAKKKSVVEFLNLFPRDKKLI